MAFLVVVSGILGIEGRRIERSIIAKSEPFLSLFTYPSPSFPTPTPFPSQMDFYVSLKY
jgi:hypothetical protein